MTLTRALPIPLTAGQHAQAMLVLGLPLVGSQLAQMALHVTDTIMVGWYGVTELAAVVLGSSVFFITFILGAGFAQAVMPMVATALGRGDDAQVRRDTRMGLWLSAAFGLAVYPLFLAAGPILRALGQPEAVAALAADYLWIAGLGMIPALLVRLFSNLLSALERTRIVLVATLAAVAVNAAVNWALIFGNAGAPELGVRGAAVATVASQLISLGVLAAYAGLHPGARRFALFRRLWRPDWPAALQVFRLGLPIGLTSVSEGGLFLASALMMGWIGVVPLAAHGVVMQVASLTFMVHVGLSSAATVRTGRFRGRGDAQALRAGARVAVLLSLAVSLATVAAFLALPQPIVGLFLNHADPAYPAILSLGAVLLAYAAAFQVADGMQVMALGLLRGLQDTRRPMWLASFSYWCVGIPASWALAFPLGLGAQGLWAGLVVGLSVAAGLLLLRFWRMAPRG